MPYTKTSWVANVTPVTAASMNNIETGIAGLSAPAPSTTPPASPADGDVWYFPEVSTGGVWQFRYNAGSASPYKWEFVGGPPATTALNPLDQVTGDATWRDTSTPGPLLTMARAGTYLVNATASGSNSTTNAQIVLGITAGAGSPSGGAISDINVPLANSFVALAIVGAPVTVTAGQDIRIRYFGAAGTAFAYFKNRNISITPIRVS